MIWWLNARKAALHESRTKDASAMLRAHGFPAVIPAQRSARAAIQAECRLDSRFSRE
jgi:hypothetical protein